MKKSLIHTFVIYLIPTFFYGLVLLHPEVWNPMAYSFYQGNRLANPVIARQHPFQKKALSKASPAEKTSALLIQISVLLLLLKLFFQYQKKIFKQKCELGCRFPSINKAVNQNEVSFLTPEGSRQSQSLIPFLAKQFIIQPEQTVKVKELTSQLTCFSKHENYFNQSSERQNIGHAGELTKKVSCNSGNTHDQPQLSDKKELQGAYEQLYKDITYLLVEKKLFKNPHLTRDVLAKKLYTNNKYISIAIKTHSHSNLNQLLIQLRVKEAKSIIKAHLRKDPLKITPTNLFLDAGFNSTTSFYRAFKQETGMSPGVYARKLLLKPNDDPAD